MSFFKRKNREENRTLSCGVSGRLVCQKNLSDPVFSQGMMGEAYGIDPSDGLILSPVDGTVVMTFPTGHAIGLRRSDGLEILIHIGVETVSLKGEGFKQMVQEGDPVRQNQPIVRFDPDLVRSKGLDPTVIFVITSPAEKPFAVPADERQVQAKDILIA